MKLPLIDLILPASDGDHPAPMRLVNRFKAEPGIKKLPIWSITDETRQRMRQELTLRADLAADQNMDNFENGNWLCYLPSWCFKQTLDVFYFGRRAFTRLRRPLNKTEVNQMIRLSDLLVGFAGWQVAKRVYRLTHRTFESLTAVPTSNEWLDDLSPEAFRNMPPWGCYIETPGMEWSEQNLDGVMAYLDQDEYGTYLSIVMDQDIPREARSLGIDRVIIPLQRTPYENRQAVGETTMGELLQKGLKSSRPDFMLPVLIGGYNVPTVMFKKDARGNPYPDWEQLEAKLWLETAPLVRLVHHICRLPYTEEYWPKQPKPVRTPEDDWRMPVVNNSEVWHVDGSEVSRSPFPRPEPSSGMRVHLDPEIYALGQGAIVSYDLDYEGGNLHDMVHLPQVQAIVEDLIDLVSEYNECVDECDSESRSEDDYDDVCAELKQRAGVMLYDDEGQPDELAVVLLREQGVGAEIAGDSVYLALRVLSEDELEPQVEWILIDWLLYND